MILTVFIREGSGKREASHLIKMEGLDKKPNFVELFAISKSKEYAVVRSHQYGWSDFTQLC